MSASSKEIEREVEATRANVENTVHALRDMLTVGDIVDEATRYFRESGGSQMAKRFGEQVRDNPLPLALVGVGLAWLMSGRGQPHLGHHDERYRYPAHADADTPEYAYRTHGAAGALYGEGSDVDRNAHDGEDEASEGGLFSSAASSAQERASEIGAAASSVAERARSRVHDAGRYGQDVYHRAGGASGHAYDSASRYARGAYDGARSGFLGVLEREPLIVGAVGVAVGAAIGAMLPRTEIEDRYMGETSGRIKDEAKSMAQEQIHRGRVVAEEAAAAASEEADAQGLTSGTASP